MKKHSKDTKRRAEELIKYHAHAIGSSVTNATLKEEREASIKAAIVSCTCIELFCSQVAYIVLYDLDNLKKVKVYLEGLL